ncbi:MAG TPA: hypothetical protein VGE45_18945 [Chloroflexia bacterium]
MAIAVNFTPESMNAEQYDEIIKSLDAAGAGAPESRLYHACFGSGDKLRVMDIWESGETFGQFAQTLVPILHRVGLGDVQPEISPIYNTIKG